MESFMVARDEGMCFQRLTVEGVATEVYVESDDEDLFLKVEGWLTPQLAQALVSVLVDRYGPVQLEGVA